jgi:hypothetical protein
VRKTAYLLSILDLFFSANSARFAFNDFSVKSWIDFHAFRLETVEPRMQVPGSAGEV